MVFENLNRIGNHSLLNLDNECEDYSNRSNTENTNDRIFYTRDRLLGRSYSAWRQIPSFNIDEDSPNMMRHDIEERMENMLDPEFFNFVLERGVYENLRSLGA